MTMEKTYSEYINAILDAAEITSNRALQKATFDKTVMGNIVACIDAAAGKYKVKVQDAYYYATINNEDEKYSKGDNVYILIPGNDNTKPKKIIGNVEMLGDAHLAISALESQFEKMSQNVVTKSKDYLAGMKYSSYDGDQEDILYNVYIDDLEGNLTNKINIDTGALSSLAEKAEKIQISAKFKTTIPKEQKRGNFGLKVDIEFFTDIKATETTVRSYILDINSMVGTLYNTGILTEQKAILDFNGKMFKRIQQISAFVMDFETNEENNIFDIFIDDIGLYPMTSATAESWNAHYLTFDFPNGNTLSNDIDTIEIIPKATYKNREVEDTQLEYYWFIEDGSIFSYSEDYCEYGGQGWKCINKYDTKNKKWLPHIGKRSFTNEEIAAQSVKYKCTAVLKQKQIAENSIIIYNDNALYSIDITSTLNSNLFYVDKGTADLTCNIRDSQNIPLDPKRFIYHWSRLNSQDKTLDIDRDNGGIASIYDGYTNKDIAKILEDFQIHMNQFFISEEKESGKEPADIFNMENYKEFEKINVIYDLLNISAINKLTNQEIYDKITIYLKHPYLSYIKDNKFYNLNAGIINEKNTFICTVFDSIYDTKDENYLAYIKTLEDYSKIVNEYANLSEEEQKEKEEEYSKKIKEYSEELERLLEASNNKAKIGERYIGTASLEIRNSSNPPESNYHALLKNGNQIFKYDANGKSPIHRSNSHPQEIKSVSFEFFDKNNTLIDLSTSTSAVINWYIPIENTMLKYNGEEADSLPIDPTGEYYIFTGTELPFTIIDTYDIKKVNNDIRLNIQYNGSDLNLYTNFSFFKEGQNGTNGTDYFCRIVPNTMTNDYPTIYCWTTKAKENEEVTYLHVRGNFFGSLEKDISNEFQEEANAVPWFGVELWNSGIQLTPSNVYWKVLKTDLENNLTPFEIISNENAPDVFIKVNKEKLTEMLEGDKNPHLTIQVTVTYEGRQYFATQPIAIVFLSQPLISEGECYHRLNIKSGTGFNEAIYAADGTNPQYQSTEPFELEVYYGLENITSIQAKDDTRKTPLDYWWIPFGDETLTLEDTEDEYRKKCVLPSRYDGLSLNNGVCCLVGKAIKNAEGEIEDFTAESTIFFPIHMYLNRYGHAHLNDWDGNSIKVSEEEGYILTPQVGAGRKETDNTFTGMLMGEVKGGQGEDKVGLMGYGHGVQTMFLDAETGSAYFGKSGEIAIEPKGEDTEVKLGNWYLDKEAIWQSENGIKTFGGQKGYFDLLENDEELYSSLYFGQRGLSLSNKLVFFNEKTDEHEAGEMKIGPWFIQNTSFWKGDPDLGGSYLKWLENGATIPPKPDPVEEPVSVDEPKEPEKPEEVFPPIPPKEEENENNSEEWDEYRNNVQAYEEYEEALANYNAAMELYEEEQSKYEKYQQDYDIYQTYLNNLQAYEEAIQIEKNKGAEDIYLGNDGFSLANFLVYNTKTKNLKIDGILNCTNSLITGNNNYYIKIMSTEKKSGGNETHLLGTYLGPNKIYFYDTSKKSSNNDSYIDGSIKYIYGKGSNYKNVAETGSRVNGDHFLFSRPICVCDSIRFGSSGVRLTWIDKTSEGNLQFNIGASRTDSFDNTYTAKHRPRTTRLMGRTLYLYAFGTKSTANTFNGTIYGYAGRYVFYNKNSKKPYISRAWTTSSDERLKNLKPLDERYYTFFSKLNPLAYTWKEDGENGKVNIGYSAQQVKQALFDSGLELNDFAGLSIDYDNEDAKEKGIEDYHTLSYEEFGPIYAAVLQRALKKIDELEERIKELEK